MLTTNYINANDKNIDTNNYNINNDTLFEYYINNYKKTFNHKNILYKKDDETDFENKKEKILINDIKRKDIKKIKNEINEIFKTHDRKKSHPDYIPDIVDEGIFILQSLLLIKAKEQKK